MVGLRKIFPILCFVAFLVIALRSFFVGRYPDFSVYYYGSQAFYLGANPYIQATNSFSNFVYPPFVLLFFLPFLLLSYTSAGIVFLVFSFLSLFIGVYLFLQAIRRFTWSGYFMMLALCLLAFPVKFTFGMGQINLVVFFLLSMTVFFLQKKRQVVAGVFLGLSLALKLFPILLLPYFLITGKIRIVCVALGFFLLLYGVTFFVVGADFHTLFLSSVVPGIGSSYQSDYYNQSLTGFFARLLLQAGVGGIVKNLLATSLILLTFVVIKRSTMKNLNEIVALTSVVTLSLIVNPFSWQHHFVWLILPFIVAYYAFTKKTDKVLLVIAYILVVWNFSAPETVPVLVRSHVLFGTILLWLLQMRFLFKKK